MITRRMKWEMFAIVVGFCIIAILNSCFHIFTSNERVIEYINKGAIFCVFLYSMFLIINSYLTVRKTNLDGVEELDIESYIEREDVRQCNKRYTPEPIQGSLFDEEDLNYE